MATIVNLRQFRKRKEREEKEEAAAVNRAAFGRPKAEKELTEAVKDLDKRRLDDHQRDD